MIREICSVELFELCETIPKVQCSECLLYWNQGVIHCTCGHLLVESESIQKFNKWRLDALSIPHYVIKKVRPHGARHGKTEAQKENYVAHIARKRCIKENFDGIHDRFQRENIVTRNSKLVGPMRLRSDFRVAVTIMDRLHTESTVSTENLEKNDQNQSLFNNTKNGIRLLLPVLHCGSGIKNWWSLFVAVGFVYS